MLTRNTDAWFKAARPEQRETLLALRELIFSVAPDAVEQMKWSRPCYSNARGMFCYLHSTHSHATLGFQKGTALVDPDHMLEGTGKDMRHIRFKGGLGSSKQGVRKLLLQAAIL